MSPRATGLAYSASSSYRRLQVLALSTGLLPTHSSKVVMSLSPVAASLFDRFRLLCHRNTPHTVGISTVSMSKNGRWILTSSNAVSRNVLVLTDTSGFSPRLIIDTEHIWVTSITWATDGAFFTGFNDGRLCFGQLADLDNFHMQWLALPRFPSAIVAIAVSNGLDYLAVATARSVAIFERRHGIRNLDGTVQQSGSYRLLGHAQPFSDPSTSITSLAFYGVLAVNLVIGASAGIVIILCTQKLRLITGNYDHKIAHLAISDDDRHLAVSTMDNHLVVWPLHLTGPLMHAPIIVNSGPQAFAFGNQNSAAPFVSISKEIKVIGKSSDGKLLSINKENQVVGATMDGWLHLVSTLGRKSYGQQRVGRNYVVQAVLAHGHKIIVVATHTLDPKQVDFVVYSEHGDDFKLQQLICKGPPPVPPQFLVLQRIARAPSKLPQPVLRRRVLLSRPLKYLVRPTSLCDQSSAHAS
ncbi:hypothetical protein FRC12_020404 [Ceratobasidium sp. 428]|nr:hypothetical protein FRC12_020404 [Ceratobasidium sp. 428]